MNLNKYKLYACFLIFIPIITFGNAVSEIPIPDVSAAEAIEIAQAELLQEKNIIDNNKLKPKEYILKLVEYTNFYKDNKLQWYWLVHFIHPRSKGHTISYRVINSQNVQFLGASK